MASIADLFFTGRLDDGPLQVDAKKSGAKAGKTLGEQMSSGIKSGSKDLISGIKLGAGIAAFGGLESAVTGVVGALGDAVQAAREDEESQARLAASLKANVAGWDGNTKAIEETITARQRLGFTDEEQRKSLALLVVATHDVTKAQQIMATAMDLARLKGISLEEASSALIKVEGGQYRALKALGIQLPKNATATEALAAVQEAANGSAEAYADTSAGKLLASQIKVGEAMEKLGYILLPVVTNVMVGLADVTSSVAEGIASITSALGPLFDELQKLTTVDQSNPIDKLADDISNFPYQAGLAVRQWIDDQAFNITHQLGGAAPVVSEAWKAAASAVDDSSTGIAESLKGAANVIRDDGQRIGGVIEKIGRKAGSAEDQVAAAMHGIVADVQGARVGLESAAQDAAGAIYDPIIAAAERASIARDIAEQQQIISSKKSTAEQVRDARARMLELKQAQLQNLATLASYGNQAATAALKHQIDVLASTKHLSSEQRAELELLRVALRKTEAAYNSTADAARAYMSSHNKDDTALPTAGHRASGGPIWPGTWTVGEDGPEKMTVDSSGRGYVTPLGSRVPSMGMSGYSGASAVNAPAPSEGGTSIHLSTYGLPARADTPFEQVTQLRRASRMGVLVPSRKPVWKPTRG